MNLRSAALTAIAVFLVLTAVFWSVSFALNHSKSGEATISSAMVANEVATAVKVSVACQTSPSVDASGLQWTQDGSPVVVSSTSGQLQISAGTGSSAFPLTEPIWTNCVSSGQTITEAGQ